MPRQRNSYVLEEFRGENNRDGLTNQRIFGNRGSKMLAALRGYHLVGYGAVLSRRGYQEYVTGVLNGAMPIQGLAMYEFGTTRELLGVSNGKIKLGTTQAWVDITGTAELTAGMDILHKFAYFYDGVDE